MTIASPARGSSLRKDGSTASDASSAAAAPGGYTTLVALTFRDFFQGGASYYGISDIAALARDTHKFESRYLDWLIGPYPFAGRSGDRVAPGGKRSPGES